MLLYGRNGSGKTTVLRLLWHLLSTAPNKGHRTALATTPFKQLAVKLGNGTQILVIKDEGLTGSFTITVKLKNKILARQAYVFPADHRGARAIEARRVHQRATGSQSDSVTQRAIAMRLAELTDDEFFIPNDGDAYLEYLEYLGVKPIFLADDRRIHADEPERTRRELARYEAERRSDEELPMATELSSSLNRTTEWLRQQLLSGAALGSRSADDVYRDVLTQLGRITAAEETPHMDDLRRRLIDLDIRTERFSEFGLAPHFESKSMLGMLDNIPTSRFALVASVLDPYLTGQAARLDSLQETERLVRIFVGYLNDYFEDKTVIFTPRTGIRIQSEDGPPIPPARLSSGERQLLLLLCRAVLSRQATTFFMIDEPELSLNAKWQRRLVQTLLDLAEGSNVQFMMATHSVEIITMHRRYLAELRSAK